MPPLKYKQLIHETDTWKRILGFMMEENIILKNRLAEILQDSFNNQLLNDVEIFQNRLIKEDEWILLLRDEMVELEELLNADFQNIPDQYSKMKTKLMQIRNNVKNAENAFGKLKSEFNRYFTEKL